MALLRWQQRYENYCKACDQLKEFLEQPSLNKFELQGLVQCFEYTFELGWKTLKDYLTHAGHNVSSPRSSIQTAFQTGVISDGHTWIDALEKRNLMAHTYSEQRAAEAADLIRTRYYKFLFELKEKLK